MLDNDPRYLRPESRMEMARRIESLAMSPTRRSGGRLTRRHHAAPRHGPGEVDSPTLFSRPSLTVIDRKTRFFPSPKLIPRPRGALGQRTSQPLIFLCRQSPSTSATVSSRRKLKDKTVSQSPWSQPALHLQTWSVRSSEGYLIAPRTMRSSCARSSESLPFRTFPRKNGLLGNPHQQPHSTRQPMWSTCQISPGGLAPVSRFQTLGLPYRETSSPRTPEAVLIFPANNMERTAGARSPRRPRPSTIHGCCQQEN